MLAIVAGTAQAESSPNFILLLTDDHGWTSTSIGMDRNLPSSASDYHETPNIDRLAREGMRFSQGYASAALCTPARRSILFGQSAFRHGGKKGFGERYNPEIKQALTIPLVLKAANPAYQAAHYGKWHIQAGPFFPEDFGYDESDGDTHNSAGNMFENSNEKWRKTFFTGDPKRTGHIVDRGVNFMRRQVKSGTPFYLQLSFYATHVDLQTREETYKYFSNKPRGRVHGHPGYAGMLADLDAGIGVLLDQLDALGIADNTYVLLMADHGGVEFIPPTRNKLAHPSENGRMQRNYPLRGGKWVLYEGGIRIPFIVKGPGIPANSQSDVPVIGYDLLPTLAELAGYDTAMPETIDGGSFVPLLDDGQGTVKRPFPGLVFHRYANSYLHSAIRVGDMKLVKFWKPNYVRDAGVELYDLSEDLGELNDLSEERPEKARELDRMLTRYVEQVETDILNQP